jgi:hypothetical protein
MGEDIALLISLHTCATGHLEAAGEKKTGEANQVPGRPSEIFAGSSGSPLSACWPTALRFCLAVLLLLTVLVSRRQLMSGQYLPGVKRFCVKCQQPANRDLRLLKLQQPVFPDPPGPAVRFYPACAWTRRASGCDPSA